MITVGIPAFNEEKSIGKAIESVLNQINSDDEVLVVDNGSSDNTSNEIKRIQRNDPRVLLLVIEKNMGKSPALNLIIENAKSEIIVQTDADVVLEKNSIRNIVRHFSNEKIGAVSGNPVPVISRNSIFYDWTIMSYRKANDLRIRESENGAFWHLSGYLCAFRKIALRRIPLVKGAVDAWMGKIIADNGFKIIYEPDAKVLVKAPTTIRDFINQKARVRAGYFFLAKKRGRSPRRIKTEFMYFFPELFRIPFFKWPAFLFSAMIYSYAWLKGWYFFVSNKSLHQIWRRINSTK